MPDNFTESTISVPHGRRWARWISDLLNPLFVPQYLLLIVIWDAPSLSWVPITATLCSLLFFVLIPLWILRRFQMAGRISSLDLEIRNQRIRPYFWALMSYAAGWGVMALIPIAHIHLLIFLIGAILFNSAIGLIITLRWKVSIHTASLTTVSCFSWLLLQYQLINHSKVLYVIAIGCTLLLPLLMWSRFRLHVHSWKEIASGALIAAALTLIETYSLLI